MKKLMLSIFCFIVMGITVNSYGQCTINLTNVRVQVTDTQTTVSGCKVKFDVSFHLSYNNGATFVYFNSYTSTDYAALAITNPLAFECNSSNTPARDAPTAGRLGTNINQAGKSFLDIGLDLSAGHGTPGVTTDITNKVLLTYSQDPSVALNTPANSGGFTVTKTNLSGTVDSFSAKGLEITINTGCNGPLAVMTDVWASNANSANAKAQCYVCGISQLFNDPKIEGFKLCTYPRKYALQISTVDPTPDDIRYKVYMDANNDGDLDGGEVLAYTSPIISISATDTFKTPVGGATLPFPYAHTNPYVAQGYIIVVDFVAPTIKNSTAAAFPNPPGCILLPVSLKSFNAIRTNRTNVSVKWETASEYNSKGFAVERKINNDWELVTYIPSQATDGNSSSPLSYQVNDLNASKGISQYRIRQEDLDGRGKLSDIRSVRGEGQKGATIVYPNPSSDGKVNVVFEGNEITKRDISVQDMNGRVIRKWNNYTNNNIQIENLSPGFYTIRIVDAGTGQQSIEKLVINKR